MNGVKIPGCCEDARHPVVVDLVSRDRPQLHAGGAAGHCGGGFSVHPWFWHPVDRGADVVGVSELHAPGVDEPVRRRLDGGDRAAISGHWAERDGVVGGSAAGALVGDGARGRDRSLACLLGASWHDAGSSTPGPVVGAADALGECECGDSAVADQPMHHLHVRGSLEIAGSDVVDGGGGVGHDCGF